MSQAREAIYAGAETKNGPDTQQRVWRVCVVSEHLDLPPDEGRRKFARSLVRALGTSGEALGVAAGSTVRQANTVVGWADRLFLGPRLHSQVRAFNPDLICYVPRASDTVFSFLRLRLLAATTHRAVTALVALQPRSHNRVGRWLLRRLAPDIVFIQSRLRVSRLSYVGRSVRWLPSGVDLDRFKPVAPPAKAELRAKYGLPMDEYLVLHVGHITRERNVAMLERAQRRWQVVIVTGDTEDDDPEVRRRLEQSGVIVFDRYLSAVEELYQAADCFLFPVHSERGSIEIPLSVLEAMACNLPVVSTRFGGLRDIFSQSETGLQTGLLLADSPRDLTELLSQVQTAGQSRTRELVQHLSWDAVASRLLEEAGEDLLRKATRR